MASLDDFLSLPIRVGTIVSAPLQKGTPEPALARHIDSGERGRRNASTPITDLCDAEGLGGLPPPGGAGLDSEVFPADDNGRGERTLPIPGRPVPDGARGD